jgi:hypothetical protein
MNAYERLLDRIRFVRRSWRFQSLARGIAILSFLSAGLLTLGVWGADLFGFTPQAVWTARLATGCAFLFAVLRFVYLPLSRRIPDVQVAQFIEERFPQLQDRLITAIEYSGAAAGSGMIDLVTRDALDISDRFDFSVFAEKKKLIPYGAVTALSILAIAGLVIWGPPFLSYGLGRLYVPWEGTAGPARMMIEVTPGDTEVNRGADQQIRAQLIGFDTQAVTLFTRAERSAAWLPAAMEPQSRGNGFLYLLVDIQSSISYYVEADGVRSPMHLLRISDRPAVGRIDLTYNFPSYTRMEPQVVENEGDISALKGTRVDLRVCLTHAADSARILMNDGSKISLTRTGETDFGGSITLHRSGSYVIELATAREGAYAASAEHPIDVIEDTAPRVSITKPMRDLKATNVEEVFTEVRAEDDIGLGKVELCYSVNGGPEKTITLHNGKPFLSVTTGSHTFFLEEFGLQPGDVISYYGKAWDNNDDSGPAGSSSDMYFIQVRPFEQRYVQSQQGAVPSGEGGAEEALSRQQKDIIAATFRLIRDGDSMDAREYTDNMKFLALVQSRLQAQAQGVVDRMQRRGAVGVDDNFALLSEYLHNAIDAMGSAAIQLGAQEAKGAMPEEQKALQQLMRAESLFREIQISFGAQRGQGSQANAEDLADLFELELNKLKNQYETIQRGEEKNRDQQLEEAMQRLKELARRQQQLNELSLQLGQRGSSMSGSSGAGRGQQQLLEEAARLQRQLQRLSRERSSADLDRVGAQLRQAIEEMKKSLERSRKGEGQAAAAEGIRALQQLENASRQLAGSRDTALGTRLDRAVDESGRLLEEQKRIADDVERLRQEGNQGDGPEVQKRREDVAGRNSMLAERLKGLADQIDDLSRQARASQRETGARLAEASGTIRDRRLPDRILSSSQLLQNGLYDFAKAREGFIRAGLEELKKQIESARNSLGQSHEGRLEDAYNKARQLAEGLESMQQRLRAPGKQQSGGTPGSGGEEKTRPDEAKGSPAETLQGLSGNTTGLPTHIGGHRDDQARQLRREFQQRLMDAEELRRVLDRSTTRMENLDEVISTLRSMQGIRNYDDPEEIARLRSAIELLRQVELDLDRERGRLAGRSRFQQADENDAPQDYRKLVEEYYKALARARPR